MKYAPYYVLVAIGLIWGSTWMVARDALERMPVMLLMGIRYLVAGGLIVVGFLCKHYQFPSAGAIWRLLPGSLLMFTLNGCLSYWSILFIPSHIAAIIGSLAPLFIFCLGTTTKKNVKLPAAMLLCVGGVVVLVIQDIGQAQPLHFFGYFLSLLAVLCWSAGVVIMRRINLNINVYYSLGWQMLLSGLLLMLLAWGAGELKSLPEIDFALLGALIYLAVPGSVIAFMAVGYIYKHLPTGIASSYEYLSILVATILGYLFLDESITFYTIIGGFIILMGIWLIQKYDKKNQASEPIVKVSKLKGA